MGSGPTCHLGAAVPGLAGVILHSPLATGMRVMNPTWTRWPSWLDVFPNIKLISKINAPTLIMHVRFWLPSVVHLELPTGGFLLFTILQGWLQAMWAYACGYLTMSMQAIQTLISVIRELLHVPPTLPKYRILCKCCTAG